jgi:hypothetical protein
MRSRYLLLPLAAMALFCTPATAQQVTIGTPFHSLNDNFFEYTGMNWGLNLGGIPITFGAPLQAAPQFGGFDPSAGLSTGFFFGRGNNRGFLNFNASQGSRRSFVTQVPSVTVMNGQTGFVSDSSQSPFVISQIPVVGGFSPVVSYVPYIPPPAYLTTQGIAPLSGAERVRALRRAIAERDRATSGDLPEPPSAAPASPPTAPADPILSRNDQGRNDLDLVGRAPAAPAPPQLAPGLVRLAQSQTSSAGRAVPSVADAKRLHEEEKGAENHEARVLFEKALTAEDAGKSGLAKVYYRMVLRRASGQLREQAQKRLQAIEQDTGN